MSLLSPLHLGNIAQALDCFRKEQLTILKDMSRDDPEFADQQEFLLTIEHTLGEVKMEYEKLLQKSPELMPFSELLRDEAAS